MKWVKRGLIFTPPKSPWAVSHAALPIADRMGALQRAYISARDGYGPTGIGLAVEESGFPQEA